MTSGFDDYAGNYDSFFFPRAWSALQPLEARLARVPAGAQDMVLCRKSRSQW